MKFLALIPFAIWIVVSFRRWRKLENDAENMWTNYHGNRLKDHDPSIRNLTDLAVDKLVVACLVSLAMLIILLYI